MNSDQWTVFGMIGLLFVMEAILHPGIKQWVANAINQWNTALGQAGAKKQ